MKPNDKTPVIIAATINGSPEKVWHYWTEPDHITKWNQATDDWHCPEAENDLRTGGKYRARMEAKDGSIGFDLEAIYDEVINLKKITYTMSDGRQVTTTFEDLGDKTKITTAFEAEQDNPVEMQRDGWQAILNSFKEYAETH